MIKAFFFDTRFGRIGIAERDEKITHVFFGNTVAPQDYLEEETPLLRRTAAQISEYLEGKRKIFDVPLQPEGTEFARRVWDALLTIPYGETRSYGQIAALIGNPKASRAVGRANGQNPLSILIPCHRVVGSNGTLTGYAGGLEMKKALLSLERQTI